MRQWWQDLLLGMIQGATEFLPVSSSGHLVLAQSLLPGFKQPGVLFDVLLHLATALAVVVYFYQDLIGLLKRRVVIGEAEARDGSGGLTRMNWRLVGMMILALIPTGIIGFLLKDFAQAQFQNPSGVGLFLILTGVILFSADLAARKKPAWIKAHDPNLWQSLGIGVAQGLAVFPGLSRSGATISTGIFCGARGDYSARFSFLLSVPAVLGAALVSLLDQREDLARLQGNDILGYLLGMAAAFIVGYISIRLMFAVVKKIKLSWFGGYCVAVGLATVIICNFTK